MSDFEEYVEAYCQSYGLTREEALVHELVNIVRVYYETRE